MLNRARDALEVENAQLFEETVQLRRENDALRGELSALKRVRKQWSKDFAVIEAQVREGQRSLERYAALTHDGVESHTMAHDSGLSTSRATRLDEMTTAPVPAALRESEKDELIEKLACTCERLRGQLRDVRAKPGTLTGSATAVPTDSAAQLDGQPTLEELLVENARLRNSLARAQASPPPPPSDATDARTAEATTPPERTAAVPDGPDTTPARTETDREGLLTLSEKRRLDAAEREVLALSLQNEELLHDLRHYMWLSSTRLVSLADKARNVAAVPAVADALRLLERQADAERRLVEKVGRLESERDSLQEALNRALVVPQDKDTDSHDAAETKLSRQHVDILEQEAEDTLLQLVKACEDVARTQADGPLAELWHHAVHNGSDSHGLLLPVLPDSQHAHTPLHNVIGLLRGIRYVARRYIAQIQTTTTAL